MNISGKQLKNFFNMFIQIDKDIQDIITEYHQQKNIYPTGSYSRFVFEKNETIAICFTYTDHYGTREVLQYEISFDLYLRWKRGEKIDWNKVKL